MEGMRALMKELFRSKGLILILVLASLASGASAVGPGGELSRAVDRELDFSGKTRLTLENGVGAIEIAGWDETKVVLHAVLRARTPEELTELGVAIEERGDELIISSTPVHFPLGFHGSIDYTLKVPNSAEIAVQNGVGDFSLQGFAGSLALELGVGSASIAEAALEKARLKVGVGERVELERVIGNELRLELGAVGHCRMERVSGKDIEVNLGAGDLEVALIRDSWLIEATVGVGSISLEGFSAADVTWERHFLGESVEIALGLGENRMELSVGMGSIELRLLEEVGV